MEPRQKRRTTQGVTIHDVAAKAGVSHMTVSRVINREDSVRAGTREKVFDAIRALNYAPNTAARSLAGTAPSRIGLLYDNPSGNYLSEFLLGALDESGKAGAQMVIERCAEDEPAVAALRKLLKSGVDGLILPPPLCEFPEALEEVAASDAVAVAMAPGRASAAIPTVRIDNQAAARDLTEHLLALGHRSFGFVKGNPNQTVSGQRLAGFLEAVIQAELDPTEVLFEQGYFTYRSGLEAAERLFARSPRPTALFAANDDMAAAALAVAHRMGLNVPVDLSIVGFDDTSIATAVWPTLTTIRQPIAAMARTAVDLVLEEIRRRRNNGGAPTQSLHPHLLIARGSSGPAPQ